MSEGLNRVTLLGNLCADSELKVTQSGTSVLNLRLATNESFKDRNGTKQERVEYHSITLWGKRAEALHKYLEKGTRILVEGSLRTSSYEDREGVKRYKTEVVASNVVFAGGGKFTDREQTAPPNNEPVDNGPVGDDDIPF